jgi:S-adenosylmethionine:tRNA ribosyltransferase-isomerase
MVFNDTKVIPARLFGKRGDVSIEITLHKQLADMMTWHVFAKPAKRLHEGDIIVFGDDFSATVMGKEESGEVTLTFSCAPEEFEQKLTKYGQAPLPPYIEREKIDGVQDAADYQTIFARRPGAIAAPTAGFHFTRELLHALDNMGIGRTAVTLHVGGGTFLPVKAENIEDHPMHSEVFSIPEEAAARINAAKEEERRIIAVGTTSLRTLEAAADNNGMIRPGRNETRLFITPGYRFKAVDVLLTNFHLPRSTSFILVSAFAGLKRMQAAYQHAMQKGYRFYSYGDACLLKLKNPDDPE